jgi:N-acetylated-alpha-linked acidic dipeptidase
VESIASTTALDVDFSSLKKSINSLQVASVALDAEKTVAENDLRRIIRKIVKRRILRKKLRAIWCHIKKIFGKECHHKHAIQDSSVLLTTKAGGADVNVDNAVWLGERPRGCHLKEHHGHGKRPWKKLHDAIKRVRKVNAKLVAFERGFIHEEGIKDREWYRHLAVAPGKWLGKLHIVVCFIYTADVLLYTKVTERQRFLR